MVKWSLRQVLICLIGSTCFTLVSALTGYNLWKRSEAKKFSNQGYRILSIVQTGPEKEALKSAYLAEILGLSADNPANLYAFNIKKGEQKLLSSPLIAKARIKRLPPNTLYIDYEVRRPVAILSDYQNIGIDKEGYLFPLSPFFSPKELPEIYLGLPPFGDGEDDKGRKGGEWLSQLSNRYLQLAFEILQFLEGSAWREGIRIRRIDVSNAFAPSLGSREIVLFTEEDLVLVEGDKAVCCVFPKMLRLCPREYVQQMNNFLGLRKKMIEDYKRQLSSAAIPESGRFSSRIVDLRIPHLALVEN